MLRRNIWTGVLGSVSMTFLMGGVFFTTYCQRMGMESYQFGVMSTLIYMMMPLSLLSASLEEWFGQRKYPWFILASMSRLVLIPLVLGFFMPLAPWVIVALLVGVVALARLCTPLWESWTWDYIPSETFGKFTARRNFWTTLARTVVAVGAGLAVHATEPSHRVQTISLFFGLLLVLGFIDLAYHVQIPEPPRQAPSSKGIRKFAEALRNRPFRNLLFSLGLWYFAIFLCSPFCIPYMTKELGFGRNLISAILLAHVLPAVGTLLALPLWGKIADRRHPGAILGTCCLFWASIPIFYYLAEPGGVAALALAWGVAGIFPAGYMVVLPLLTRKLSGADKTMPAALVAVVVSLGAMSGSGVGTAIVHAGEVRDAFAVSFVARVTAALIMLFLLVARPAFRNLRSA